MPPTDRPTVVALEGHGRVRGEMYGSQARDLIGEATARWRANVLDVAPAGLGADAYLHALVHDSGYREAVGRRAPDLLEEIAGIADAAGVDEDVVFGMNLLDEEWVLRDRLVADGGDHHCTSIGQMADGAPVLIAQNLDLKAWMDGLEVLLELAPVVVDDDLQPAALVPSVAGMLGTQALNAHGLGVVVNTLAQLPSDPAGLPVAFVVRLLARERDVRTAEALLHALPHASGQNYLLGDPREVLAVECSAGGAVSIAPESIGVAHTNHPLRTPPRSFDDPRAAHRGGQWDWIDNSKTRLQHAREALGHGRLGLHEVKCLLTTPPVLRGRDGDPGHSLFGIAMECATTPVLHMSAGEPRLDNFRTFALAPSGHSLAL